MKPAPLDTDRLIGDRYVLESLIAKGGMGEVWRARHKALKSLVAIKFLHRASAFSKSKRKRFLTEAQVTANLKTRHAVQVFDFGVTEDGLPYLVMEFLEGETLEKRIAREGRLSIETTFTVLRQAARALDRAHALGIVHRDFKPENIVIFADEEGAEQVKVVDFGIAKIVGDLELSEQLSLSTNAGRIDPSGSVTNTAVGTPYYMAPEQIEDQSRLGPAADIWAFGIVAYECLTGRRPFNDASVPQILRRIINDEPPILASARAPVPDRFDHWFAIACARCPEERFPDAYSAVSALAVALDMPAVPTSPSRTSAPSGEPAPKRVVSPLAATLDARKSARPPGMSPLESDPSVRLPTPLLPPPDRQIALPWPPPAEPADEAPAPLSGILPPPPAAEAEADNAEPSGPAREEAPIRPIKLATDAPIEHVPRLSRAGRPARLPLGVVFLAAIAALAATTIAIERRVSHPSQAQDAALSSEKAAAPQIFATIAPPAQRTNDEPSLAMASTEAPVSPPPRATSAASGRAMAKAPMAAEATVSPSAPSAAAPLRQAPSRKPAQQGGARGRAASTPFQLPPLGL